jgi:orotate phosphoribosyltransferase
MAHIVHSKGGHRMHEKQKLLNDYVATSRAFADAVQRLQQAGADVESFIRALDETGTARRGCERARMNLHRYLEHRPAPATPAADTSPARSNSA